MLRDPDCIFCKIHAGELPATIVNRGDGLLAIEDINPKADVHVLVIPEHETLFPDFQGPSGLSAACSTPGFRPRYSGFPDIVCTLSWKR